MEQLNEAFISSFVKEHWNNPNFKVVMEALRKAYPDLDINRLTDDDFVNTNVDKAVKLNADVIKFWINGKTIMLTTRSNSFFDRYLEVKKNKRGALIGNNPAAEHQCLVEGNKYLKTFTHCFILDVQKAIRNGASIKNTKAERNKTRAGAYALLTNRQIKEMNMKRYVQMLKDRNFSDGSEFNLVNNVNKIFMDAIKKNGSCYTFFETFIDNSWFLNSLAAYSSVLSDYIVLLDKNGFLLPNNVEPEEFGIKYAKDDETKLATLRATLKKAVDDVKSNISSYQKRVDLYKDVMKMIGNQKLMDSFQEFCTSGAKKNHITVEEFKTFVDTLTFIENNFYNAVSNPNISSDIMNFDMFVTQLQGIREQLRNNDQISKIRDFVFVMAEYAKLNDKERADYLTNPDMYISPRTYSINPGIYKRVVAYIGMIFKI